MQQNATFNCVLAPGMCFNPFDYENKRKYKFQ